MLRLFQFVKRVATMAAFLKISYIDFKCEKDAYWSGLYIIDQTNIIQ